MIMVVCADAKVAPHHRVGRVQLNGTSPVCERIARAVMRVAPVTEQGGCRWIRRIGGQGHFEGCHII